MSLHRIGIPVHFSLAFVAVLLGPPARLPAADFTTIARPIRVICPGDSVTAGLRLKEPAKDSYPAKLQLLLGSGYAVSIYGVSSCTLPRLWLCAPKKTSQ